MAQFIYKSKGTADDWTEDKIEASDKQDAIKKLDQIFGITRDSNGKQTNPEYVQVEIVKEIK